jgi:hypothetical protein
VANARCRRCGGKRLDFTARLLDQIVHAALQRFVAPILVGVLALNFLDFRKFRAHCVGRRSLHWRQFAIVRIDVCVGRFVPFQQRGALLLADAL